MTRRFTWGLLALAAVLLLAAVSTHLVAQRPAPPPVPPDPGPFPARFVVVKFVGDNIILLDSATGDLYRATPADYKLMADKPKFAAAVPPPAAPAPLPKIVERGADTDKRE
jgi:hypothetical protein